MGRSTGARGQPRRPPRLAARRAIAPPRPERLRRGGGAADLATAGPRRRRVVGGLGVAPHVCCRARARRVPAPNDRGAGAHGSRRRRGDWVVHETRALRGVDLDEVDGIPCTSVARTIIDLAAVAHPFQVGLALDDASRRWPGTLEAVELRSRELARRGRRGIPTIRALLDERAGRGRYTDSGFETRAVRMVRAAGLPEPVLQHTVRDGQFVAHLDLAWPKIMWAVECDSLAHHSGKRAHEWDRRRRRRLKALGWDLVEITYDDVTKRRAETTRRSRVRATSCRRTQARP